MNNDLLFLFICILVLIIFGLIVGYWFYINSKDYTVNDTIKGFYQEAGLNQRCSVSKNENETLLLPQYYEPQSCGYNMKCVLNSDNDIYGYCKSDIGGVCYSVYDCIPSEGTTGIACIGGICAYGNTGFNGVLYSNCGYSTSIGNSQCDLQLGLTCVSGTCLYLDGQFCYTDSQCSGKKCDIRSGLTGVCISQIPPTQYCDINFCQNGFGCDFINGNSGYCQPISKNGNTGTVIKTGDKGALCSIPLYPTSTTLECNNGLICSFDPVTMTSDAFPGITGYGLCQVPLLQASEICSTSGSACAPPNVCSSYNSTFSYCQAPLDNNGFSNINYCGYGSTTQCRDGYSCVSDFCLPNSNKSLCGGSGVCINGLSCSSNKLGIFTPIRSGGTGVSNFGSWQYIDLPSDEDTIPNDSSFISSYQFMSIEDGEPVLNTRLIYLPVPSIIVINSSYFWYLTLTNKNNTITYNWRKITITDFYFENSGYGGEIYGIKFTPSGNISINTLIGDGISPNLACVYIYNFNPVTFSSNNIDLSFSSLLSIATNGLPVIINDWDIDDKFNLQNGKTSASILINENNVSYIYYGSLDTSTTTTLTNTYTYTNSSSNKLSTFVRYVYDYKNVSNGSFIFNGSAGVNGEYNLIIPNMETSTNTLLPIDEEFFNGVGMTSTYLNTLTDMEFYYISNRGFKYYNAVYNNSNSETYNTEDVPIQGYVPDFDINTSNSFTANTLTYGTIDRSMYALISLCS